jgi:hypothetical protein
MSASSALAFLFSSVGFFVGFLSFYSILFFGDWIMIFLSFYINNIFSSATGCSFQVCVMVFLSFYIILFFGDWILKVQRIVCTIYFLSFPDRV